MGRYMAAKIPGAKWVEFPGTDHMLLEPVSLPEIRSERRVAQQGIFCGLIGWGWGLLKTEENKGRIRQSADTGKKANAELQSTARSNHEVMAIRRSNAGIAACLLLLAIGTAKAAQAQSLANIGRAVTSDFKYLVDNTVMDREDIVTSPVYAASPDSALRSPRFYLAIAGWVASGAAHSRSIKPCAVISGS